MTAELYAIGLVVVLAAMYFFFAPMAGAFVKFRGKRVIICPETLRAAAVDVDVAHAALTAVAGNPDLRLTTCTRWPERKDCGQECLLQIEISPEGCLARTMLEDWYRGKKCVLCRVEIGEIYWSDHKPAMLSPQGRITECGDISPEQLPD
ncbi:MAG TPA: hypothetical protein VFB82_16920, partial [Blastocatellia bacterium]|nr:hypothetical protein [Blastocatellia bacterium]